MASIKIYQSVNGYEPYAILTVTQGSQSVVGNYTTVNWSLVLYRPKSVTSSVSKSYSVTVGGKTWSGTYTIGGSGDKTIASGSVAVYHNANGVGSVSFSASVQFGITWSGTSIGTCSNSSSMSLTTIPRVSDLTVDKTTVPADEETTVTATGTKKSSSFTDTIVVTLGSYSKTVTSGVAFTIPEEWINAISGTSATATITLTTKSGSTQIGTKTASLTITVPDDIVPSISDILISEAITAVTNAFGDRFVQSLTKLNVEVDAEGIYGSTIKSYNTEVDGVKYTGQTFQSNAINGSGTLTIKATVTDSRGRSAERSEEITVIEYSAPSLIDMTYQQCDSDGTANSAGTYTKITITGKVSSVEDQNTKSLSLQYKKTSDSSYSVKTITVSDYEFEASTIISGTSSDETWEFVAELVDAISDPVTLLLSTGKPAISRRAGAGGVTLFGEAEQDGFVVAGGKMALFTGEIYIDDPELEALYLEVFPESGGGNTSS